MHLRLMVWVGAEPEPVVLGQIIYILYISNLSCCNMSLFQTCILLKKQLSQKLLSDVTEKALCVCVCVPTQCRRAGSVSPAAEHSGYFLAVVSTSDFLSG